MDVPILCSPCMWHLVIDNFWYNIHPLQISNLATPLRAEEGRTIHDVEEAVVRCRLVKLLGDLLLALYRPDTRGLAAYIYIRMALVTNLPTCNPSARELVKWQRVLSKVIQVGVCSVGSNRRRGGFQPLRTRYGATAAPSKFARLITASVGSAVVAIAIFYKYRDRYCPVAFLVCPDCLGPGTCEHTNVHAHACTCHAY